MLKISNLKKYFNRGRPNEIRAVDDITLTLEGSGLVVLLGKSGCGKTTLLNCIGGLDATDNGSVNIDGIEMTKYNAKTWDALRNKRIGYIFQNYNLINDVTVYQNLETVLKLAGLSDKAEYAKRIEYALQLVGMHKYKSRRPDTLSGGQQQRVGIARALVKGADIIIADEPTGNLDDKNTMAVMEILKGISEHCLVVLVTHEERLASFYGDRIIRLVDGKVVSDIINESTESLEHRHSDIIYLGDLEKREYNIGEVDLTYFFDKEQKPIKLDIISHEGKLLLRTAESGEKLTFVGEDSTIKLLSGKYQKKERKDKNIDIDQSVLSKIDRPPISVFKTAKVVANAFNNYLAVTQKRKNNFKVMLATAFFISMLVASVAPNFVFDAKTQIGVDSHVLMISDAELADLQEYEGQGTIKAALNRTVENSVLYLHVPNSTINTVIPIYTLRNSLFGYSNANFFVLPYSVISDVPLAKGEVLLDDLLYERLIMSDEFKGQGLTSKEKLIGQTLTNMPYYGHPSGVDYGEEYPFGEDSQYSQEYYYNHGIISFTLKGFVARGEPVIYLSDADYEGLNRTDDGYEPYVYVYADNVSAAQKLLSQQGFEVENCKKAQIKNFYNIAFLSSITSLVIVAVIMLFQIIAISKVGRAAFIGKIKQLTILRAIGTPRKDIMKGLFTENSVQIALSTIKGWLVASIIISIFASLSLIKKLGMLYYPWWLSLALGAFLFGVSIFTALLKPFIMLRKTPAELMAKYDI